MPVFKPYKFACEPCPGAPYETLLQDGWNAFLVFKPSGENRDYVIVECENCSSTRFGYPNDEGLPEHPHYRDGLSAGGTSIFVSEESPWLLEITTQERKSSERIWGGRGMQLPTGSRMLYHFIIPMKEATFECIASGLKVAHRVKSYEEAFAYVRERFSQH